MINIFDVCGFLLVGLMMLLVFVATRFVSTAQFNGNGIWQITIRAYIRRDIIYLEWIKSRKIYLWSSLLVITLCVSILGLIGSFSQREMFNRPQLVLIVSPFLWLSILKCYLWFVDKLKEKEGN